MEQGVTGEEGTENPAELNFGKVKLARQQSSGNGNVHAIEVSDRAEDEQPEDQQPTDPARSFDGQARSCIRMRFVAKSNMGLGQMRLEKLNQLRGDDFFLAGLEHE